MEAYVTLVATDSYAAGALTLSHKLRDLGSNKEIVCLVTPNISSHVQELLSKVCTVIPVDTIRSRDFDNLELLGRPELDITFTKIQLWRLTQYSKIVYLDADTYPLRNIDELFDKPSFSAAPDAGWPDCFNSGVFVTEPSEATFNDLLELSAEKGSFDGGDQGLLNTYFSSWSSSSSHRLPFTFNTTPTSQYGYAPAHNQYGHNISILHFIGQNKPWKYQRFTDGKVLPLGGSAWEGLREMVQEWWNTWDKYYSRIPPYHLLSGEFDYQMEFDSGFQTRPIVPFDEEIKNAWDNQQINLDDQRRIVNPMPPISNITISHPQWTKNIPLIREEEKHEPYYETQSKYRYHHVEHQHRQETYHEEPRHEETCHKESHSEESHHEESHQRHSEGHDDHNHHEHSEGSSDHNHHEHSEGDGGHNHHKHDHEECHEEHPQHKEVKTYSMIEWDPAYQDPPNTGSLGADIPDLSSFKNVWDQSHIEQQNNIWVAPVHQPEPKIMTKPEYSNYNTDDYNPEHLYPTMKYRKVEHHHEEYQHGEEQHEKKQHHEEQHHEEQHHEEQHHEEQHHEHNHHEEQQYHEENHHRPGIVHPPSFPWDSIPNHFPAPTRVWQPAHQQQQWPEEKRYLDDQKPQGNEEHQHNGNSNHGSHHEKSHYDEHHEEYEHKKEDLEEHNEERHEEHHQDEHHQDEHHHGEHHHEEHHHEKHHHEKHHHEEHPHEEHPHEEHPHEEHYNEEHYNEEHYNEEHHNEEHHNEKHHHEDPHQEQPRHREPDISESLHEESHSAQSKDISQEDHTPNHSNLHVVIDDKDHSSKSHHTVIDEPEVIDKVYQSPLFAIDEVLTPSGQIKIDEFIAALAAEDRDGNDVSDRDLIPIKFKSSSRLQTGMYTPSPVISTNASRNGSRSNSRNNSRSNSRRASVSSSRRGSVISKKPSLIGSIDKAYTLPEDIQQPSKLFAGESSMYSRKTPYTSAAATPAALEYDEDYERDNYFVDEPMEDDDEAYTSDFLEPTQYSLSESLEIEREAEEVDDWNPNMALDKLKEHSESMVLRQSLHEALVRTAKQQEKEGEYYELATEPVITQARTSFKSSWDDEEYDLPSAMISGQSTPRTPVARSMSSNLSREIELEKERHKQQRASLMLVQPQTAEASVLEAELDLSQGTLFKRRYYEDSENGTESIISTNDSTELFAGEEPTQEPYVAYYDYEVIKEAQRKLRSLVTGDKETEVLKEDEPLPITKSEKNISYQAQDSSTSLQKCSEEVQPFGLMFNRRTYLPNNFGFDQNHKLHIYQADLLLPDSLNEIKQFNKDIELKEGPISKKLQIANESKPSMPKTDSVNSSNETSASTMSIVKSTTSEDHMFSQTIPISPTNEQTIDSPIQECDALIVNNTNIATVLFTENISDDNDIFVSTVSSDKIYTVESKDVDIDNVYSTVNWTKEYASIANENVTSAAKSNDNSIEKLIFTKESKSIEEPISTEDAKFSGNPISTKETIEVNTAIDETSETDDGTATVSEKNVTEVYENKLPVDVSNAAAIITTEDVTTALAINKENITLDTNEESHSVLSSNRDIPSSFVRSTENRATMESTTTTTPSISKIDLSETTTTKASKNVETSAMVRDVPVNTQNLSNTTKNVSEKASQTRTRKLSSSKGQSTNSVVESIDTHASVKLSHKNPKKETPTNRAVSSNKLMPATPVMTDTKPVSSSKCDQNDSRVKISAPNSPAPSTAKPLPEKPVVSTEGYTKTSDKTSKIYTTTNQATSSGDKTTKDNQGKPETKLINTDNSETPTKDVSQVKVAVDTKRTLPSKVVSHGKANVEGKKSSTYKPVSTIKTNIHASGVAPLKSASPTKVDSQKQETSDTSQAKSSANTQFKVDTKEISSSKPVSPSKSGSHKQKVDSQTNDTVHTRISDGLKGVIHTKEISSKSASPTKADIHTKEDTLNKAKATFATKTTPHTRVKLSSKSASSPKVTVDTRGVSLPKSVSPSKATVQTKQVSPIKDAVHSREASSNKTTVRHRDVSVPSSISNTNINVSTGEDSPVKSAAHNEEVPVTKATFASKAALANKAVSSTIKATANSKDRHFSKAVTSSKVFHTKELPPVLVRSNSKSTPVLSATPKALPEKPATSTTLPPKSSRHSVKSSKLKSLEKKQNVLETTKTTTSRESSKAVHHHYETRTSSFTSKRLSSVTDQKDSYASVTKSHASFGEHHDTRPGHDQHHSEENKTTQAESPTKTSSSRPIGLLVASTSSSSTAVVSETDECFTTVTRSSSKSFTEKRSASSTELIKQDSKSSNRKNTKNNKN